MRDRSEDDGHDGPGSCNFKQGKIWIDKQYTLTQQEETLVHEIIEAINWDYELELSHKQIQGMAATIYQVLKDNPSLQNQIN